MYREPDRFHCVGAAVSGGVHYTGGSRRVFAAAAVAALHAAHPVRHGSGHHAGGQCVEPAAACYPARTDLPLPAWIPSAVGLVLGAVGLLQVEQFAGQLLAGGAGHGGRMVLAVTLHNLPEGMVAGLAAALALTGEPDAISGALALSLGIGLQNIPEGAAVSLPLAHNGRTRSQAFLRERLPLVEPLGHCLPLLWPNGQYCASVAAQRSGGLYGVRDRTGDDPAGRGGRRACRCCKHRAGICADDGTGCGIVRKKGCCKINAVKITG